MKRQDLIISLADLTIVRLIFISALEKAASAGDMQKFKHLQGYLLKRLSRA